MKQLPGILVQMKSRLELFRGRFSFLSGSCGAWKYGLGVNYHHKEAVPSITHDVPSPIYVNNFWKKKWGRIKTRESSYWLQAYFILPSSQMRFVIQRLGLFLLLLTFAWNSGSASLACTLSKLYICYWKYLWK